MIRELLRELLVSVAITYAGFAVLTIVVLPVLGAIAEIREWWKYRGE